MSVKIIKRNGESVDFSPNKILNRIRKTAKGLNINSDMLAIEAQTYLTNINTTTEIDDMISKISAQYAIDNPDYSLFSARIVSSKLQKDLGANVESWKKRLSGHINPVVFEKQEKWGVQPNYKFDHTFDFIGIMSFITIYGVNKEYYDEMTNTSEVELIELPCEMYFRVALYLSETKEEFKELYSDFTNRYSGCATPVMTNGGTNNSTMISCSVNELMEDSLNGMLDTEKSIYQMSKDGSGIGLWTGNLRSEKTRYANKGKACGVVKFAKSVNEGLRRFKQNESRRGKGAMYINIYHRDLREFINLASKTGTEETTARDLMLAIWSNDLFYKRLKEGEKAILLNGEDGTGMWSLFCPHQVKQKMGYNLFDYYGEEFEKRYLECEANPTLPRDVYSCEEINSWITNMQSESGHPYLMHGDNINRVNNQRNYGIIKTSQLCAEIVQYTAHDVSSQCCLGAVMLGNFISDGKFDYVKLRNVVSRLNYALNRVIDKNKWSNEYSERGGLTQRATAIGVSGLADAFYKLNISFESDEAKEMNKLIFENIYYGAIEGSIKYREDNPEVLEFAKDMIDGTELGKGKFTWEFYDDVVTTLDWDSLRSKVLEKGVSNSMFTAIMPTASSSTLALQNEMVEPMQDIAVVRKTIAGEFPFINKYLINDINNKIYDGTPESYIKMSNLLTEIKMDNSVQEIDFSVYVDDYEWVEHFKMKYKTIWELKQRVIVDLAGDRQPFIDQAQSMNLYWADPDISKLTSASYMAWKRGLKTSVYYTKTKPKLSRDKSLGFGVKEKQKPTISPNEYFTCFDCSV